jgi:sodium/pantothenate symporter
MRWDILIPIAVYLLVTFFAGIFSSRFLKPTNKGFKEEFFLGGRNLGPVVLAFTILATYASAGTFIGTSGVAYEVGFGWVWLAMSQLTMGVIALGIPGKKFAIVARKINAVTLTDFLYERYSSHAIVIGSALGIVVFISATMVAQFVAGARILQTITGVSYYWGLLIFGFLVVTYTSYGGFRAVALTDAIQGMAMALGGVILWGIFLAKTDGVSALVSKLAIENPDLLTIPGPGNVTPSLLFSYFILLGLSPICLPQVVNRSMAYKDSKSMHRAIVYSCFLMGLFTLGFATLGPLTRALYPDISIPDNALPTLIINLAPGWLAGLILAAPIAAIMSTIDSMLLVVSSAVVKDVYSRYINPNANEAKVSKLAYITTLCIGTIVVILAISPPRTIQFLTFFTTGGLASTFFAPTIFGLYWKRATTWGAVASMYVGAISYAVIFKLFPNLFNMHAIVPALILSVGSMIIVSLLTPAPSFNTIYKFWGRGDVSQRTNMSLEL